MKLRTHTQRKRYAYNLAWIGIITMLFFSNCEQKELPIPCPKDDVEAIDLPRLEEQADFVGEKKTKKKASKQDVVKPKPRKPVLSPELQKLYTDCKLKGKLDPEIFRLAVTGYCDIAPRKNHLFTIIDYSKPSTKERLFVIDLKKRKILYHTLVSHGRNTGMNMATSFSNRNNSKKSSLGFFLTAETYYGKHGYSLRLDGLERGINDNARKRAIVIHAADYVSKSFVWRNGRLGRSWGCPALPKHLSRRIIDKIKKGSCVFIYGKDKNYLKKSVYFKQEPQLSVLESI